MSHRHRHIRRALPLALALLAVVFSAGCEGEELVPPIYEILEEEVVVVVPFKEPFYRSRWNNDVGVPIFVETTKNLQANAEFTTRPIEYVVSLFDEPNLERLSPADIADLCKADFVLLCELITWEPRASQDVGLERGKAKLVAQLYQRQAYEDDEEIDDLEAERQARYEATVKRLGLQNEVEIDSRGGKIVAQAEVDVEFPDNFMDLGIGQTFITDDEARLGLIKSTGREAAKLLFEHEEVFKNLRGN